LLDVGCGNGALLNHLRTQANWELWGVEPHQSAARFGIDDGLAITPTLLEHANLPEESVDLVIMNHVLEHLPDPRITVSAVYRVLKPGGYFVGEIPSPYCLERLIFQQYWGGFHLPRHLTFFKSRDIRSFLTVMGFDVNDIHGTMQSSNWVLSFANFLKAHHCS